MRILGKKDGHIEEVDYYEKLLDSSKIIVKEIVFVANYFVFINYNVL